MSRMCNRLQHCEQCLLVLKIDIFKILPKEFYVVDLL